MQIAVLALLLIHGPFPEHRQVAVLAIDIGIAELSSGASHDRRAFSLRRSNSR